MQVLTNFRLVLRNLETSLKEEKKNKTCTVKGRESVTGYFKHKQS